MQNIVECDIKYNVKCVYVCNLMTEMQLNSILVSEKQTNRFLVQRKYIFFVFRQEIFLRFGCTIKL